MKAMELRELSKSFHGHRALREVTLEVPQGAVYGFLGPNGAGKTTAIRVLMGLLKPGGGAAFLLGEPVRPGLSPALKRKIGYLPEEPAFPEALTGFEVLDFVRRVNGIPAEAGHARIDEVLDRFALSAAAHRRAAGYSRGMKQRLGLACVLLPEPELYILDEPVSALDPVGRLEILELLASLRGRATVFFSSHVLADVERVCDRVAVLHRGRLLLQSSLDDLLERYQQPCYRIAFRETAPAGLADELRRRPWAQVVENYPGGLVVQSAPDGLASMEEELLPLLVRAGAVVTAYERQHEELEMIFLKLLREADGGGEGGGGDESALR
ncbi:MAG TPA: ABC transporter ATP-binding protein [Firmicutes bacterium]|nr:ABC transporter ATP-binding protein [Bacillota bacterium]